MQTATQQEYTEQYPPSDAADALGRFERFYANAIYGRRSVVSRMMLSEDYRRGDQVFYMRSGGEYPVADNVLGSDGPVVISNVIADVGAQMTAMIMAGKWQFQCATSSVYPRDQRAAKFATAVIKHFDEATRNLSIRKRTVSDIINVGLSLRKIYYDHDAFVPVVLPGEELAGLERMTGFTARNAQQLPDGRWCGALPLGDVRQQVISAFRLFIQSGVPSLHEADEFAIRGIHPIRHVLRTFPDLEGRIDAKFIADTRQPNSVQGGVGYPTIRGAWRRGWNQQDGTTFTTSAGLVEITEHWCKYGPEWYCVIVANDNIVAKIDGPFDDHPYVEYCFGRTGDFFWPEEYPVWRMTPPQRIYNRCLTGLFRRFTVSVKDMVFMPKGSDINLSNRTDAVYQYNSAAGGVPIVIQMPQGEHRQLMELTQVFRSAIFEAGGLSEMARGQMPSRTPGKVVQLVLSQDSSSLGEIADRIRESDAVLYRKMLRMKQTTTNLPQTAAMYGCDTDTAAKEFLGVDLVGNYTIRCVPASVMPQGAADRMDLAAQLAQAGVFDSPERAKMFSDFANDPDALFPQSENEKIAEYQVSQLLNAIREGRIVHGPFSYQPGPNGQPILIPGPMMDRATGRPVIDDLQMPEVFVEDLTKAVNAGDLQGPQADVARVLIAEYRAVLTQKQIAEAMQQLDFMGAKASREAQGQKEVTMIAGQVQGALQKAQAETAEDQAMLNGTNGKHHAPAPPIGDKSPLPQPKSTPAAGNRHSAEVRGEGA